MKYSDLQPGDMFNTILGRYVKQLDGSAMEVVGLRAGQATKFNNDTEVIPLFVAKERASLHEIIEAADELSAAIWYQKEHPDPQLARPIS